MHADVTYRSIFRVALVILGLWLVYQVVDVLAIIFFGIIIAAAIGPEVDKLEREGIPRLVGAILIYLLIILAFAVIVYLLLPPTVSEVAKLSNQLPLFLKTYFTSRSLPPDFLDQLRQNLTQASANIFTWLIGLLGGLGNVLFVFIISFYLTVEDKRIKRSLEGALPDHRYSYVIDLVSRSQRTLSQWLKAQLILMIAVGVITGVALSIIGVPNAIALGALTGMLEIVPFVGPVISAIPAVIFAFTISPLTALVTLIVFIAIQQIESHILTPQVMKRAFEINPVLVLIALFTGAKLGGTIGILASVPLLALVLEFSKDYYKGKLS